MRDNADNRLATVQDKKSVEELMEQGRQLHSKAIFDTCAAFLTRLKGAKIDVSGHHKNSASGLAR